MVSELCSHVGSASHEWDATFPMDPTDSISFKETILKATRSLDVVEEEVEEVREDGTKVIALPPRERMSSTDRPTSVPRTARRSVFSFYNSRSRENQCFCHCRNYVIRRGLVQRHCLCPCTPRDRKRPAFKRRFLEPGPAATTSFIKYLHGQAPNNKVQASSPFRPSLPVKGSAEDTSSTTF